MKMKLKSNEFICDRCKKIYTPKGYIPDDAYDDEYYPHFKMTITPKPDGKHWLCDLEQHLSFCDECQDQLKKWLYNPDTKVTEDTLEKQEPTQEAETEAEE